MFLSSWVEPFWSRTRSFSSWNEIRLKDSTPSFKAPPPNPPTCIFKISRWLMRHLQIVGHSEKSKVKVKPEIWHRRQQRMASVWVPRCSSFHLEFYLGLKCGTVIYWRCSCLHLDCCIVTDKWARYQTANSIPQGYVRFLTELCAWWG